MRRFRKIRKPAFVVALVVVLASCAFGESQPAERVTDVSAQLTGRVHNTITGPTEYWFEYGPTTSYGTSTPHHSLNVTDTSRGYLVEETVLGLVEGTAYHSRLCALDADGHGTCGSDTPFTTTAGRDSVTGSGTVLSIPENGYALGASLGVTGAADGSSPTGDVTTGPGSFYFKIPDTGPVTCLRVNGNRATIGFVAQPPGIGEPPGTQPIPKLVFIEDNGPSGDRYGIRSVASPATTCPPATNADFVPFTVGGFSIPPEVTAGDFAVHDHHA